MPVALWKLPTTPMTSLSAQSFSDTVADWPGLLASSTPTTAIFIPATPPLAFHSSTASCTELSTSLPGLATEPESAVRTPSLIALPPAGAAAAVVGAAATTHHNDQSDSRNQPKGNTR